MSRLFTFGCSYTATEFYPSWAGFLGLEYDEFQNWGVTGIGCRAIAERIAECHVKNKFTADDTIIVQWTTHLRHDFYNPNCKKRPNAIGWKTAGNMFFPGNQDIFNKQWTEDFFFEAAYIMHSLNFMSMIIQMLENIGCTWYMTSIGEWRKLGTDVFGNEEKLDMLELAPELVPYYNSIWVDYKDHWVMPIELAAEELPDEKWYFRDAKRNDELYLERHPSPKQYAHWLNKYLRPRLDLGDPPKEQAIWIAQLEQIKKDVNDYCLPLLETYKAVDGYTKYGKDFWPPAKCWPIRYEGF